MVNIFSVLRGLKTYLIGTENRRIIFCNDHSDGYKKFGLTELFHIIFLFENVELFKEEFH